MPSTIALRESVTSLTTEPQLLLFQGSGKKKDRLNGVISKTASLKIPLNFNY